MAMQTQYDPTNGSGDPVPADDIHAHNQAARGLRPPPDAGSGRASGSAPHASYTPSPQSGIYVPPGMDPGDTPEAGDVDPGATASADETGQGGNVWGAGKRK